MAEGYFAQGLPVGDRYSPPTSAVGDRLRELTATPSRRRTFSVVALVLLHLAVFWAAGREIDFGRPVRNASDLQVSVVAPNLGPQGPAAPPVTWLFQAPEDVTVPEPAIDIAPDPNSPSIATTTPAQTLPPRGDPGHVNAVPDVPYDLRRTAAAAAIVLRIFVLPDGSIGDVRLVKGSANADLDRVAMEYVKDNWRFQPAVRGGREVEDWTTVVVRFASRSVSRPDARG